MARLINNEVYLSPQEAGAVLGISYKTLQRWVEAGGVNAWTRAGETRKRAWRPVEIKKIVTPTGFRLYEQSSVLSLRDSFTS